MACLFKALEGKGELLSMFTVALILFLLFRALLLISGATKFPLKFHKSKYRLLRTVRDGATSRNGRLPTEVFLKAISNVHVWNGDEIRHFQLVYCLSQCTTEKINH